MFTVTIPLSCTILFKKYCNTLQISATFYIADKQSIGLPLGENHMIVGLSWNYTWRTDRRTDGQSVWKKP